jgi:hypothetical protein
MCLGALFIAPRQLGAVESIPGRKILPSVAWPTGHCPVRISFLIWRSRPLAALEPLAHRTLSGAPSRPLARPCVPRRSRSRPLAHRTVRCTLDSPVNFSHTSLNSSRERQVRLSQPGAPDTIRCTTGQSGAPRLSKLWLNLIISFPTRFFLFPALRHNTLVHKTMY